jgi:hypothetical protein
MGSLECSDPQFCSYSEYAFRPVGAELFHAEGQTDRHNGANIRVSQFCESAKNDREMETDVT